MSDKPIQWVGTSKEDLKNFPEDARYKVGSQLRLVQKGYQPTDFKPMPTIGKGVEEIRVFTGDTYRVFYVARFPEAVYILHAFGKKTQKTSKKDIDLGKKRYQQMIKIREDLEK
ncbi:type II toxin-antitoxin system RelE/ParE family toxin [Cyanobacterium aponinum FACHB-4101]|uniref:type II toxin-antitoxin system RelE/ParE family toxin n=1 Tax=Cyanobacterium aponinum TaxID=379064 RepID=UPI001680ACB0|nr:type II toxin-antitoxin system RelE/ParE family toxin [Cyanobacterium aponinum]MBD2395964.1 type II toxin-antitoxin system RelE/ParE family toxin [Cyanobacterium aponinum FACHB-4101]